MQKVFIFSYIGDVHADFICKRLEEIGAEYFRFDTDAQAGTYQYTFDSNCGFFQVSSDGKEIVLDKSWNIWNRRIFKPKLPDDFSEDEAEIAVTETGKTLDNLLVIHKGRVIDRPLSHFSARNKLEQLLFAEEMGFPIPSTLVTNDPEKLREFYASRARSGKKVCHKLQLIPDIDKGDKKITAYTGIVGPNEMENADLIRVHPAQFQDYIEKTFDLRITALKHKIVGVAIYSKETDFRKYSKEDKLEVIQLPERIERFCFDLLSHYGLNFSQIDMVVKRENAPDGSEFNEYYFLELNSAGQWLWLELLTGYPLSKDIAELLVSE